MFLRFSVKQVDEDSRKPRGVFRAAYDLLDNGELDSKEREQLRTILDWFDEHLPSPPEDFYASRATFWFKSTKIFAVYGNYFICCGRTIITSTPSDKDGKITIQ